MGKNAKHFNSFQAPFFVSLSDVIDELNGGGDVRRRFQLATAEEDSKKRDLICHRCGVNFKRRFADLKRHIETCNAPVPAALLSRCTDAVTCGAPGSSVSTPKRSSLAQNSGAAATCIQADATLNGL